MSSNSVVLYDKDKKTGVYNNAPDSFEEEVVEIDEFQLETDYYISLYDKVGAYYKWSWKQFYEETPYHIIKSLNDKIDHKMENMEETIFSFGMLDVLLAISRAFGGSK